MLSQGWGSCCVSDSSQGWLLEVGLASGRHADFSRSEGSVQVQMARFPLGWQADSWVKAPGSPILRAQGTGSWGWKSENQTELWVQGLGP